MVDKRAKRILCSLLAGCAAVAATQALAQVPKELLDYLAERDKMLAEQSRPATNAWQEFLQKDRERAAATKREAEERQRHAELLKAIEAARTPQSQPAFVPRPAPQAGESSPPLPRPPQATHYLVNTPQGLVRCSEINGYVRCN